MNDEAHHIPDTIERQIEKWMDDSNCTLRRKPKPNGTNNGNITHARRQRRQNEVNYKDDTQNHQNNSEKKIHTHETIQHKTTPREAERKADRSEKEEGEENNTRRDERSNQEDKEQGRIVEHKRGNDINQAEQLIRKHTTGENRTR